MLTTLIISLLLLLPSSKAVQSNVSLSIQDTEMVGGVMKVSHAQLHFRWDNATYESDYLDNAVAADKLMDLLREMGHENIDSVSVVAYASPEGVYEHNLMLSRKRAREFSRILEKEAAGMSFKLNVRPGGEAWDLLAQRVKADTSISETARSRTLKQLADKSISNDTRKWRFMHGSLGATSKEGDVYHYLLINHYRFLRCLDIHIHYKEADTASEASTGSASEVQESEAPAVAEPVSEAEPASEAEPVEAPVVEETKDASVAEPAEATEATETKEAEPVSEAEPVEAAEPAGAPQAEKPARRPILGISTNLPYDITYIPQYGLTSVPSLSVEYYPVNGKYSFGGDVEFSHWLHPEEHRYNQIRNLTLWGRRYFKRNEDRFKGLYLLANINAAQYGLGFNAGKGWEGEGLGVSVGGGWKFYMGKYFFLDMGAALGLFYSWYDPYVWGNDSTGRYYYDYSGDPNDFVKRSKRLVWFGPTRLYIAIGLDIYGKRK
ncbi:MAG: DUF3575 domain-containing protein [Bacteroidales bacterium]|nr:DUF3575 domain-containing protein [Bacteroidales bacterium]